MKRSFLAILGLLFIVCISQAAPKPAVIPVSNIWTINTEFAHPQKIIMQNESTNQLKRYWYMIITLTNNTGRDVDFYPNCELMTDTFQIIPAGKGVASIVFERIKERHRNRYPFLKNFNTADNKLLQGEDNACDLAIIWEDFDKKAQNIKVFITGLSNETAVVEHPVAKDQERQPIKVYLRKTLELSYDIKGDPALISGVELQFNGKRWIMR
ncbi:hypothetical protein AMJ80_10400 [bacterium SM23_31]|nr:MAG: hypothetical protein AMJ80_10400 [bacterium SM23_31]